MGWDEWNGTGREMGISSVVQQPTEIARKLQFVSAAPWSLEGSPINAKSLPASLQQQYAT